MTTQQINTANALITAKEIITKMLSQGLSKGKYVFALSNMLSNEFNLTQDESVIVIEEALKIA